MSTIKRNEKGRVAVFLSGRGTNFEAIWRASRRPGANYQVVLVVSDVPGAPGLDRARRFGVEAIAVSPGQFPGKAEYETRLVSLLEERRVELICLAGYMRLVGRVLLQRYAGRIINIHPALLPAFPGLHAQRQALEYGARVSGCTVHFVDAGVDSGPIILQRAVRVRAGDSEERLSRRILRHEHRLYARAIRLFFKGRLHVRGRRVIIVDDET